MWQTVSMLLVTSGNRYQKETPKKQEETGMELTLNQAAKEVGKAKSTLSKAIKSGKLSAALQEDGSYRIDASELFRVFPPSIMTIPAFPEGNPKETPSNTLELTLKIERLEAELDAERRHLATVHSMVVDYKERLDASEKERRQTTRLLEDARGGVRKGGLLGWFRGSDKDKE